MSNDTSNSPESRIDVAARYRISKSVWLRTSAPKATFADYMPHLRLVLFIVAFFAMFALSASHTSGSFKYNVEGGVENAAPLAFEVFLTAVMLATTKQEKRGWIVNTTILFIVLATIYANGASGITVASARACEGATAPCTAQFGIYHLFALITAPIVPLATIVIGHMISDTLLHWQQVDRVSAAWRDAELEYLYRDLQSEAMKAGLTPGRAGRWAFETAKAYIGTNTISAMQLPPPASQQPSITPTQSEDSPYKELAASAARVMTAAIMSNVDPSVRPSVMPTNGTDVRTDNGSSNGSTNGNKPSVKRNPNALDDLRTWVRTNQIDVTNMSVDQFWEAAKAADIRSGRTSAAQVLAELQAN